MTTDRYQLKKKGKNCRWKCRKCRYATNNLSEYELHVHNIVKEAK